MLIGWALTRASLLFSVTPLPLAAVLATPTLPIFTLLGVLLGLWQGAPQPVLLLVTLAIGLALRLLVGLFFYPFGAEHAALRRKNRRIRLHVWKKNLSLLMTSATDRFDKDVSDEPNIAWLPVSVRTWIATVSATCGSIGYCLFGRFSFYDLWGALFFLSGSAVACALFSFSMDDLSRYWQPDGSDSLSQHETWRAWVGHATLLCACCFCLRGIRWLGIFPALAALLVLSLRLHQRRGLLPALSACLTGGFAIGMASLPALCACVVVFAMLSLWSKKIAVPLSLAAGLVVALAGGRTLFFSLAPSLCVGMVFYTILAHFPSRERKRLSANPPTYSHDVGNSAYQFEKNRYESISNRLCTMAGALDSLGEVILYRNKYPDDSVRGAAQESLHAFLYAKQYRAMAGLLQDALSEDFHTLHPDDELAHRLGQELFNAGAKFRQITCLRRHDRCHIRVEGCSLAHIGISADRLHQICERVSGCTLQMPLFDDNAEPNGTYLLRPRAPLQLQYYFRSQSAVTSQAAEGGDSEKKNNRGKSEKSSPCGDSMRFFFDNREQFYALLCDGMGSGEEAAQTSDISVLFLERLLRAGVGIDTALTLLNQYLCSREGNMAETTSTVDMMVFNLFSGKARFVKSGAADSLVLRDRRWYVIGGRTAPLGIWHSVDAQMIPFTLEAGDHVLMMSDGIADALTAESFSHGTATSSATPITPAGQGDWLYSILDEKLPQTEREIGSLLDRILTTAREHGSMDDMTAAWLTVTRETSAPGDTRKC